MPTAAATVARRLAALFLAGLVLLLSPLVGAFNDLPPVAGFPAPVLYLLGAWTALLVLARITVGRARR